MTFALRLFKFKNKTINNLENSERKSFQNLERIEVLILKEIIKSTVN